MSDKIYLRDLQANDEEQFLQVMNKSKNFHYPFVSAPLTSNDFQNLLNKSQMDNNQSFLVLTDNEKIAGIYNLNEIVRGVFQSAYLGYYVSVDYAGKGIMSKALKMVLNTAFNEMRLHRIEANIQPTNTSSIQLVTKNGFRKEGFSPRYLKINGCWQDHFRFALTIEDWLSLQ